MGEDSMKKIHIAVTANETQALEDAISMCRHPMYGYEGKDVATYLNLILTKIRHADSPLARLRSIDTHAQDAYLLEHEPTPDRDFPEQTEPDYA